MARPRTFDPEDVLDRALETFWKQGYRATSIQDLVEATGINRASLYNTFGGKHDLYLEVLDRYRSKWTGRVITILENTDSVKEGVRRLFERVASEPEVIGQAKGCLMTNTATELAARDPACAEKVRTTFAAMENALDQTLRRGQDQGEIDRSLDTRQVARFLTNNLQGLRVMTKAGADRQTLHDIIDTTVQMLE